MIAIKHWFACVKPELGPGRCGSRISWGCDDFEGAGVAGLVFGDEFGGADQAVELGTFFESDGACAEDLPAHVAVDAGGGGGECGGGGGCPA
jgi:hypothetical protein